MDMRTSKSMLFTFLTFIAVGMVAVEWLGLFNGINTYIDTHIPIIDSFWVSALTTSAGIGAFGFYIMLLLAWDLRSGKLNPSTMGFVLALIVGMFFVLLLKAFTGVPRPNESPLTLPLTQALLSADYFAFPSGHATRASILACFMGERLPKYRPLLWVYAVLVGLSRMFLHVHWFSDVLFGILLGFWVSMLVEFTAEHWLPVYNSIMQKLRLGVFRIE